MGERGEGVPKGWFKWDMPEAERSPEEEVLDYAREIETELKKREKKQSEVPWAGNRSRDVYLSKFAKKKDSDVFKEDILKIILKGGGDNQELMEAFVNDEINECRYKYQMVLEKKGKAEKEDPKGHGTYESLRSYYEFARDRVRDTEAKIEKSEGEERKSLEQDLEKAEREAEGFIDEMFSVETYGKEMRKILNSTGLDIEKKTDKEVLEFIEDRVSRLRGIRERLE